MLCTNTMHRVAPAIEDAIGMRLLHLVDTTAGAVRAAGLERVGLLGTRNTMEGAFYRDRLAEHGLEIVIPEEPGRSTVHDVIYSELVRGQIRPASRRAYLEIIDGLGVAGAQGVVAGCTEIELLISSDDVSCPWFPTTRLHALAAAEWALER